MIISSLLRGLVTWGSQIPVVNVARVWKPICGCEICFLGDNPHTWRNYLVLWWNFWKFTLSRWMFTAFRMWFLVCWVVNINIQIIIMHKNYTLVEIIPEWDHTTTLAKRLGCRNGCKFSWEWLPLLNQHSFCLPWGLDYSG